MNRQLPQSSVRSSRSLTERVLSGVGRVSRVADTLPALWRGYKAHSRDQRARDAITDMNEHMLKDIGAHDRLISHAAARSNADHRRRIALQLSTPLLVVALIATATPGQAGETAPPKSVALARAQPIGNFTGEYVHGIPVYRLPPLIVVASRKVERAKLAREDRSTRAQQAPSKAAARNPA